MAKRLTQPSLKISKKQPSNHQFNTLIKVLKPKVFITNSTNFKTLVQELTGNGSPMSPPQPTHLTHLTQIDQGNHSCPDRHLSPDMSSDHSLDNMFVPFDYSNGSSEDLGLEWCHDDQGVQHVNEIDLENLESWLLDFDSSARIHDAQFAPMNTYEYDYMNLPSIM